MRSKVVLPQPDGPKIEKKLPGCTEKDSESTARWSAKRFTTASAAKSGVLNWQP
jgi:hypothetical protein